MRVLVTGGGGFIGSHLVTRLLQEGHEVRVLDNFATGRRENLIEITNEIELIEGDVQSYERAHVAVRGCELVFHQAALPSVPRSVQDPLTSNASNVIGTLNVLLAARDSEVRRVIFASSSSVYGPGERLRKREEMALTPISPYAVGKLAAEAYCRTFWEVYGLETIALRYFNVFGPRQDPLSQYAAVICSFVTAALAGRTPIIFGDGEQSRDFTYVDNVVEANLRAMSASHARGMAFNVACGEQISLKRLLEELREITGTDLNPVYEAARPGDLRHSVADISRARAELGWSPTVNLREGLERTIRYYEAVERPAAAQAMSA